MAFILSFFPTEEYCIIPYESSAAHCTANQTSFPATPCILEDSVRVFHEDFLQMWFDCFSCVCFQSVFWKQPVGYVCTALRVACGWSLVCCVRHFLLDCTCFSRKHKMNTMNQIINRSSRGIQTAPMGCLAQKSLHLFRSHGIGNHKPLHTATMWAAILFQPPFCDRGLMHIFNDKIRLTVHMNV